MSEQERVDSVAPTTPTRVSGTEALKAHVTLAVGLLLCAVAFWFELRRALGGNSLSWAYVFEWPLLGIFAIYMWWRVIHPSALGEHTTAGGKKGTTIAPEFDNMLAAWQAHQADLAKSRETNGGSESETK